TREIYDLARREGIEPLENLGLPAAAAVPLATFWVKGYADWEPVLYVAALWLLALLVVAMARGPARRPLTAVAVTVFGILYASVLLAFTVAIRHGPHSDAHPRGSVALVLLPLAVTWVCDTCAMAACSTGSIPSTSSCRRPRGCSGCSASHEHRRRDPGVHRLDRLLHASGAGAPAGAVPRRGAHGALQRGAVGTASRRMEAGVSR